MSNCSPSQVKGIKNEQLCSPVGTGHFQLLKLTIHQLISVTLIIIYMKGSVNLLCEEKIINSLSFAGPMTSLITVKLCHCKAERPFNNA